MIILCGCLSRSDLVQALKTVCSEYGKVLDVMAKKNIRMRGQAFVVFEDTKSASLALAKLKGLKLYEKELVKSPEIGAHGICLLLLGN